VCASSATTTPAIWPGSIYVHFRNRVGESRLNGRDHEKLLDVAGNGRFIRNVIEDAFGEQMYRISDLMDTEEIDNDTLTTITAEDLSTAR
jgi:hypothetical protein